MVLLSYACLLLAPIIITGGSASSHAVRVHNRRNTDSVACRSLPGPNIAAHNYGKYFGTATAPSQLSDQAYGGILNNWALFGQLTPAVGMKWSQTEPEDGYFTWADGDAIMDRARANGQLLRCHALVWHQDLPSWLTSRQWDRQALIDVLWRHITTVVQHYKGVCFAWDVVNEALNDDGSLRSSIFLEVIGPAYIAIAFSAAALADPTAKLYYNDYNIDNDYSQAPPAPSAASWHGRMRSRDATWNQPCGGPVNSKITGAKCLVSMVRSRGGKIDGIGLQGHYVYNATPSTAVLTRLLNDYAALNLDVAITELDIRMDLGNINAETATMQAQGYANVMTACRDSARCVGVTLWDFTDRYSWVTSVFPSLGSALPWDSNLVLKQQIFDGVMQAWIGDLC